MAITTTTRNGVTRYESETPFVVVRHDGKKVLHRWTAKMVETKHPILVAETDAEMDVLIAGAGLAVAGEADPELALLEEVANG